MGSYRAPPYSRRYPGKRHRKTSNNCKPTDRKITPLCVEFAQVAHAAAEIKDNGPKNLAESVMVCKNEVEMETKLCKYVEQTRLEQFPEYDENLALELLSRPVEILAMTFGPASTIDDSIFDRPPQLDTFRGRLPPGLENDIMQRHFAWLRTQYFWGG